MSELFGTHAPFVWGALAMFALGMAVELAQLWRRARRRGEAT